MRAVSFLGTGLAGTAAAVGAPATGGAPGDPGGLGGCPRGPVFTPGPGGFMGPPGRPPSGLSPGSAPGSGFGENAGMAGNDEGGGGTPGGTPTGEAEGGGVMTRVVSFLGLGVAGATRMVCTFTTSGAAGAGSPGAELGGGAGLKRTVSRFTTGESLGFEGSVMRTVSFLGRLSGEEDSEAGTSDGGVSEGVSSAIINDFHFLSHCGDLMSTISEREISGK